MPPSSRSAWKERRKVRPPPHVWSKVECCQKSQRRSSPNYSRATKRRIEKKLFSARAEKTLGAKFNIRAFHDAVLELGSLPLPVVTARIDRFITEGGKGPYPDME